MKPLRARSAIITGASRGIGASIAVELARRGVRVGLTARRADLLESVAEAIRQHGGEAVVSPADASDRQESREAIARLIEAIGPVDLLVANAGIGRSTPAVGFSSDVLDEIIRVNLIGAAVAIEAVLPGMIARKRGHIVGISSLAGYRGLPGSTGYGASKAALSTLLDGMRPELRGFGIAVSIVHPGFVETSMTADARHHRPLLMDADRAARIIVDGIARGRRRVDFPWQMHLLMRCVRNLPDPIFDRIAARVLGDPPDE